MPEYTEKDWKLFRSKVPGWQEAYMDRLNKEYIAIRRTIQRTIQRVRSHKMKGRR